MKTYKTWEIIKALSENNSLEFKMSDIGGNSVKLMKMNSDYCMNDNIAWDEKTPFEINRCTLQYEWELVQQPVDFMAAINSGKKIKSEYMTDYDYVEDLMNTLSVLTEPFVLKVINGKWFIESED